MTEVLATIAMVVLMALFIVVSIRYFKKIRDNEADPIIDPSWPTIMRPSSPPPWRDPNDDT